MLFCARNPGTENCSAHKIQPLRIVLSTKSSHRELFCAWNPGIENCSARGILLGFSQVAPGLFYENPKEVESLVKLSLMWHLFYEEYLTWRAEERSQRIDKVSPASYWIVCKHLDTVYSTHWGVSRLSNYTYIARGFREKLRVSKNNFMIKKIKTTLKG